MYGTVHGKGNDNCVCRLALFGESPHLSVKICLRISYVMENGRPSESTMQQFLTLVYRSDINHPSRQRKEGPIPTRSWLKCLELAEIEWHFS